MTFPCESEGPQLVLLGRFNPAILQPAWLEMHGLVRTEEAEHATIELIRPEASVFRVGELSLTLLPSRFDLSSTDPKQQGPIRDLAAGIFALLEHTPVHAMGINRNMHFRTESEDAWHQVGHTLAPKDAWEGLLNSPGMRSVTMQGGATGSEAEYLRVTVEPSKKVEPGVYVSTNEHFQAEEGVGLRQLLGLLDRRWDEAQQRARTLAQELLNRASGGVA